MREQSRKVELTLVSREELLAELQRREMTEFREVFNSIGPAKMDLHLFPSGGARYTTQIIIFPDGTWSYA